MFSNICKKIIRGGINMKLKNTLILNEAKFAVEVEDIGTVIVDCSSEAEVKSRLSKS